MAKNCRCCLSSNENQQLLPLFEDNRDELYRECTELPATLDDLLSNWICETCLSKCNKWKDQQTEHIKRQKSYYEKFRSLIPVKKLIQKKCIKYSCDICDKRYKEKHQLELHIEFEHIEQTENNLVCKICLITFGSMYAHKMHHKQIHSKIEKPKRIFECDKCDAKYTLESSLRVHKKVHTTPNAFVCETCGKFFPHKRGLKNHLRAHSTDKPYKCTFCDSCYKTNAGLLHHIYLHNPSAIPHGCSDCDKRFRTKTDLKIHFANKHLTVRPFKCKFCPKSFGHARAIKVHESLHQMDGGPFNCDICDQVLKNKSTLKNHMESHNPNAKNIFSCEFCGRTGRNKIAMQHHRLTHTGEKPHQCTLCDQKFQQKGTLNLHMRKKHKEKELEKI